MIIYFALITQMTLGISANHDEFTALINYGSNPINEATMKSFKAKTVQAKETGTGRMLRDMFKPQDTFYEYFLDHMCTLKSAMTQ